MKNIMVLLEELGTKIPHYEKLNTSVSRSTVGWHIQHSLLTIEKIIQALEKSDPKEYRWKFNVSRFIVFSLNKIPRGKAKAPKIVVPTAPCEPSVLYRDLEIVRSKIMNLSSLQKNSNFHHPYFGRLNLKSSIKILRIHTKHHLAIIDSILA